MRADAALWHPRDSALVPTTAQTPTEIAEYARQLTARERSQIVEAFTAGSFEMTSLFVWNRSMAALKKQIASLGAEFVGEMLDRTDITADTPITRVITDFEAVSLAEKLGMFDSTESMRLRHAMELISHFADRPPDADEESDREMMPEEALQVFRTCVRSVLGHARLDAGLEFAQFRSQLEERSFRESDEEVSLLRSSPPFYRGTTIRTLMALAKTSSSAQLEHVLANVNTIVPSLWDTLAKPERWIVGKAYAEVHASGQRTAASGIRKALLKVRGFDYVPEDLRSRTFIQAAKSVQEAHFGMNNFYNEPAPMSALASLGSIIPMPAFPDCMTAALCVRLGNAYGISYSAQSAATTLLGSVSGDRWVYYMDQCLQTDDVVLDKISRTEIAPRWIELCREFSLADMEIMHPQMRRLFDSTREGSVDSICKLARALRVRMGR